MNKLVGHDESDPKDQIIADVAADLLAVIRKHAKILSDETERSMSPDEIQHSQSIVDAMNMGVPGLSANMTTLALRAGMLTVACLGVAIRSFMENDHNVSRDAATAALEAFGHVLSANAILRPDGLSAKSGGMMQ